MGYVHHHLESKYPWVSDVYRFADTDTTKKNLISACSINIGLSMLQNHNSEIYTQHCVLLLYTGFIKNMTCHPFPLPLVHLFVDSSYIL